MSIHASLIVKATARSNRQRLDCFAEVTLGDVNVLAMTTFYCAHDRLSRVKK
ncbi:MAG: hypothetical protein HRU72_06775 [Planctomycetia bacterium]|uniref:hypothetical protein n=1 Tax=Candidatus Brocadia sapporoensis TaxID=392547 RepID=UPI0015C4E413|nr:hypothetical protein [Candidatus Brocadia sapporoensis]MCC7240083.1 hypothetical protein [Candidatus Brocadia sp.]QOJ06277.1 MAG: hypothetical protein HRU72_06775 [Planctomycetia bacterium]HQU31581.1 hypothetical protein [Candidatus Brocadia sapporoensis]